MAHITPILEATEGEILPVSVDLTNVLAVGESAPTVSGVLAELTQGTLIAGGIKASPSPAVTNRVLTFTLDASTLKATNRYQAAFLLTVTPNQKVLGVLVPIDCVNVQIDA